MLFEIVQHNLYLSLQLVRLLFAGRIGSYLFRTLERFLDSISIQFNLNRGVEYYLDVVFAFDGQQT